MTVQDALKGNSIEIAEESLLELKYDPASILGYIEVCWPALHYCENKHITGYFGIFAERNSVLDF